MNIRKLNKYDLHQAEVGDQVVCWSLNKGEVVYIDHNQVVVRWEDTLNIFDIEEEHSMYFRPLAWLGNEPIYKGDKIYSGCNEYVVDRVACGRLYSVSGSYMTMEGDKLQFHELFSLTPIIKTIVVNGFDVPAPMERPPEEGTDYYVVSVMCEEYFELSSWFGDSIDMRVLERGLAHTTEEAAVAHTKAMLGIDPEWRRP